MSEHPTSEVSKPSKGGNFIINYFQESFQELKKVTWPTRNQAIRLTFIVIGFCIVFTAFVGILDIGFNQGYRQLVNYAEKVAPPAVVAPSAGVTGVGATSGQPVQVETTPVPVTPTTPTPQQ